MCKKTISFLMKNLKDPYKLSNKELGLMGGISDYVISYYKIIGEEITRRSLENRGCIPGYITVNKNTKRKWKDGMDRDALTSDFMKIDIHPHQLFESKVSLKPFTHIEKISPSAKELVLKYLDHGKTHLKVVKADKNLIIEAYTGEENEGI